jgi:hypothetical protein
MDGGSLETGKVMIKMPILGPTKVDKFFRKRDVSAAARNLAQLTADPTIFLLIHKHFARLLTLGKADQFFVNSFSVVYPDPEASHFTARKLQNLDGINLKMSILQEFLMVVTFLNTF